MPLNCVKQDCTNEAWKPGARYCAQHVPFPGTSGIHQEATNSTNNSDSLQTTSAMALVHQPSPAQSAIGPEEVLRMASTGRCEARRSHMN